MWWILYIAVFLVLFWYFIIKDEENPLDKLPGPPRLPILGSALGLLKIKPDELFSAMQNFTELYGERYIFKVFRLRVLHISSPSDAEAILTHSKNLSKSQPYMFLRSWLGNGLLLNTGHSWHRRRKTLTPTFHFNILKNFSVVIEESCQRLVEKLKKTEGKEVDVMPLITDFTLSIICETAMGTQLDSDKSKEIRDYKTAILNIGHTMVSRLTRVWLHSDVIFKTMPIGRRFNKSLDTAIQFADRVIKERKKQRMLNGSSVMESDVFGSKRRMAMLDLLLEAEMRGEIDFDGIKDEVNTFMFAGHDTTAMALTFCLMMIADHEEVQERIYEESQRVLGDTGSAPSLSDLTELKYLEAVIKETMRLLPSVPFIGRVIDEDFMLGNLLVKKGSEVSLHIYQLHRREELFPEPMAFKPERFLNGHMKHPYAFVPFSAGPRNCIGQRFAMQEMKSALLEICRHFMLVPRQRGTRPRLVAEMVLRPDEPIYIKFIPR